VFTSAAAGAGIAELLDVIVRLLPNPTEGNPPVYLNDSGGTTTELTATPDPAKHALAHVIKVEIDPYIGRVAVFRVHQGRFTPGSQLYVGESRKPIRAGHLYMLRGKTQVSRRGAAGRHLRDREDRRDPVRSHPARLARRRAPCTSSRSSFRRRCSGLRSRRRSAATSSACQDALHKLAAEDPCFRIEHVAQTNETVLRGLGRDSPEDIARQDGDAVQDRARHAPAEHPYRETIAARAEGHSRTRSRPAAPASSARST
jgi:elongation factor G